MLVLSWHFKAATMCEFSKEEFVSGMQRLGCDSLERVKTKLPEMRRELRDEAKFRQIYDYAYMCDAQISQLAMGAFSDAFRSLSQWKAGSVDG